MFDLSLKEVLIVICFGLLFLDLFVLIVVMIFKPHRLLAKFRT